MKIVFIIDAWNEYVEIQETNKQMLKKINRLIQSISRNGTECEGKPKPLVNYEDAWSVRIDKKNRIVFRIEDDNLIILECGSHYQDK